MLFMGKSTISMAISHFSYAFNTCFIRSYRLAVEGPSQTLCLGLRGKEWPKLAPDPRAQRAALAAGSALRATLPPMGHRQLPTSGRERNCVPPSSAGSVRAFDDGCKSVTMQVLIVKEPAPFTVSVVAVPYLKVQAGQTTAVGISQGQREQLLFALDRRPRWRSSVPAHQSDVRSHVLYII